MAEPIKRSKNPIPPGVDIGHVHMKTADIAAVYRFYVDILGFDVVADMGNAVFMSSGGYHHHLAFNTWESKNGPPPAAGTTGLYHIAIRYPKRSDLADALQRLIDTKWPIEGASDHGTHEAIYLRDQDENGLELYWDRPEKEWPLDEEGHLKFTMQPLNFDSLLSENKSMA